MTTNLIEAINHCQAQLDGDYSCGTLNKEHLQTVINAAVPSHAQVTADQFVGHVNKDGEFSEVAAMMLKRMINSAYPNGVTIGNAVPLHTYGEFFDKFDKVRVAVGPESKHSFRVEQMYQAFKAHLIDEIEVEG